LLGVRYLVVPILTLDPLLSPVRARVRGERDENDDLIGSFERSFPGRLRVYYAEGSYADRTAIAASDIDLVLIFKNSFVDEDEAGAARRLGACCACLSAFELDLDYFDYHTTAQRSYSSKFVDLFGAPRPSHAPLDPTTDKGRRYADIAASVQRVLEDTLVDLARDLQKETGLDDLCFGGGVALNGCANARILRESGFSRLFVPCAPGDAGCALGAALYADRVHFKNPDRDFPDHPYWGPRIDAEELARVASEDGLQVETAADEDAILDRTAKELANGRIVGWMDGAAELGPRALGNRSILAAPHTLAMKDRLNKEIKYREEFRPFAPAVPIEVADRYFDLPPGGARLGAFMSGVFPVRAEWRDRLAAITHVDGTARVQTVEKDKAPRFYSLIERYGKETGIPILLNTSFNLAGEPIVTRAVEGYSTFRRSGIDILVAGCHLVTKPDVKAAKDVPHVTSEDQGACSEDQERSVAE
jgi:carbamoyltransferase